VLTARRRRDGSLIDVVVSVSPLFDASGTLIGMSSIASDVTELIAARDALARSEARFRSLVQRSADVAFVFDKVGTITYVSPAVVRFGYDPRELVGRPSRELIHPDDIARFRDDVVATVSAVGTATMTPTTSVAGAAGSPRS